MRPKLLILPGATELGNSVLQYLQSNFDDIKVDVHREDFNDGTNKIQIFSGIKGTQIFILVDPYNRSTMYEMAGQCYPMSPDMHMMAVFKAISAIEGDAEIHIIMPCLYGSRQHTRTGREDIITAFVLRTLEGYVERVITYDIHSLSFDCVMTKRPLYKFPTTKMFLEAYRANNPGIEPGLMFALGTDEGALKRARDMARKIGTKRFDTCSKLRSDKEKGEDGYKKERHELIGRPELLKGMHVFLTDDIGDSGTSLVGVLEMLQDKECASIDLAISFGLFPKGIGKLQEAKNKGWFRKLYITDLTHVPPEIRALDWVEVVSGAKSIATAIKAIVNDESLEEFF